VAWQSELRSNASPSYSKVVEHSAPIKAVCIRLWQRLTFIQIGLLAFRLGNPPERRVEKLREFWETVSSPPLGPFGVPYNPAVKIEHDFTHRMVNQARALGIMLFGAPGFFDPRFPSPVLLPSHRSDAISYYVVAPLKATLERLVDFDRINKAGEMRLSAGAVNVRAGNSVYFDTKTDVIGAAHVIASGSLPPGFPATEIEGVLLGCRPAPQCGEQARSGQLSH
jgi:predicted acylesterase/phospholipase RssA